MSNSKRLMLVSVMGLILYGCAGLEVAKVDKNGDPNGFVYYLPHPYLLVTNVASKIEGQNCTQKKNPTKVSATEKNSTSTAGDNHQKASELEYKIIYLPDMSQKYAVTIRSGFGSVNTNMKFEDGWKLTEVGGIIDTKIPETLNAISGLMTAAAGIPTTKARPSGMTKQLDPGLYRINYDRENRTVISITYIDINR